MRIDHVTGRDAFVAELELLLDLAGELDDHELLAVSRCHGWTVADVLTHVHLGLQEMCLGLLSPTEDPATVDAATYWSSAPPTNDDQAGDTDHLRHVRMLTDAYRRPSGVVRHLDVTGRILARAAARTPAVNLDFQGHVIATGDYFASWAVELAVHHLDSMPQLIMEPPTAGSLHLARRTVEELAGGPLPHTLGDCEAVLVGTGRNAPPPDLDLTGQRLPAFG